jgi:CHAT domain-containing protein
LVELFHFQNKLRIFIIRSDFKEPKVISQKLSNDELSELLETFPSSLLEPIDEWSNSIWRRLSELICGPLMPYLKEKDRIIIVPHKLFHFLPLHLLLLDEHPLIEKHAIVYSPSASLLQYCQHKNPKRNDSSFLPSTLAAFGLDFEKEVDIVARHFKSPRVIFRSDGPIEKEDILSACINTDVIHFSGHGDFRIGFPDKSGLVLNTFDGLSEAERKIFNLHDIYNLQLNSYLVTLGAAQSSK